MSQDSEFESLLEKVVASRVDGVTGLVSVERLSGGASQETYRLTVDTAKGEKRLAMRRAPGGGLPSRVGTTPGLAVEAQLMRVAHDHGIPEPVVHHVLEPDDGLGEGFLMEWLEGEALGPRIVRSPDYEELRPKLAFEFGEVLGRIHRIDLVESGLEEVLSELPAEDFIEQTWERYRVLDTPQPMIDYVGRWLVENLPQTRRRTLVHNDFRNGNVMVDRNGVVAVLDWEVAHIGDPGRDLGWVCTNSWRFGRTDLEVGGFGRMDDFLAGYESTSGIAVDPELVKFWMIFGSFWWAGGTLGMAQSYRGPVKSVERPGIGRRTTECQVDCVNLLFPGPVELVELSGEQDSELPRLDELVSSVRDFLREEVMEATSGRLNFLSRVAGNSLDVVYRDLQTGERHRELERSRLQRLLDAQGSLTELRWKLVHALRDGSMDLENEELKVHLRQTIVNQIAIDQPRYSGYKTAAARAL